MPGMGWLDRFRKSPSEETDVHNPGENYMKPTNDTESILNNNKDIKSDKNLSTNDSGHMRMPAADLVLEYRQISDLTQLDQITLDNVLDCLVERFYSKEYYTFAGSVLISLNPCRNVSRTQFLDVECMAIMTKYYLDAETDSDLKPPHVYSIGLRSLKNLCTVGNNQVIIVSGDSGAGKTTSTQQLIRYFTETNQANHIHFDTTITVSNLEKKIYFATVVLESFGNASTISNPNSSRFGRLVQLSYDNNNKISGAEIKTYLLEKHRVAKGSCSERNFHIFYFLMRGIEMGRINLEDISEEWTDSNYEALADGLRESDTENMLHFFNALKVLNMTTEFKDIFRVVFAIMKFKTVEFTTKNQKDEYSDSEEEEDNFIPSMMNTEFTFKDFNSINIACSILGAPISSVFETFVSRKIMAGAGGDRRLSIINKPCESEAECKQRLHDFIILLYDKLFTYVLAKLNYLLQDNTVSKVPLRSMSFPELGGGIDGSGDNMGKSNFESPTENPSSLSATCISLLDLYGFENLEYNHLEQICINYANERLQQVHISALKSNFEQELSLKDMEFRFEEPLELNRVEVEIGNRIEELHHIFSFLNEECVLKRKIDDKNIFERMVQETRGNEFVSCGRFQADESFIVRHYATDVSYHFRGIPDKNKDYVPPEFGELLSKSTNHFIRSLFKQTTNTLGQNTSIVSTPNPKTPKSNVNERGKTILKRFKTSVDELVKELQQDENQDLHFIRCIRPNFDLQEGKIQPDVVKQQLYSCGIVDVIRIAGNGYPIRIRHSKFEKEFPITLHKLSTDKLSSVFSFKKCPMKIGRLAIFMNEKSWNCIRKMETYLANRYATILQRWIRKLALIRIQKSTVEIPSPPSSPTLSNLGDSIYSDESDETVWFTPSMTLSRSSLMSPVPGPFGDWRQNEDSFLSFADISDSLNSNTVDGTMDISEDERTLTDSEDSHTLETREETLLDLCEATGRIVLEPTLNVENVPLPQKKTYFCNGNGIVSRAPVHSLPIKIYTKRTVFGYMQPPQRLLPNGLQDCFTDYEIHMEGQIL